MDELAKSSGRVSSASLSAACSLIFWPQLGAFFLEEGTRQSHIHQPLRKVKDMLSPMIIMSSSSNKFTTSLVRLSTTFSEVVPPFDPTWNWLHGVRCQGHCCSKCWPPWQGSLGSLDLLRNGLDLVAVGILVLAVFFIVEAGDLRQDGTTRSWVAQAASTSELTMSFISPSFFFDNLSHWCNGDSFHH